MQLVCYVAIVGCSVGVILCRCKVIPQLKYGSFAQIERENFILNVLRCLETY